MRWLDWLRAKLDPTAVDDVCVRQGHFSAEIEENLPARPEEVDDVSAQAGLDFYSAIAAHQRWKNRLKDVVLGRSQETLDPAVVGRCDACDLGIWLEAQANDARIPAHLMDQLKQEHAQFHSLAADIIRLADQGQSEEAMQALRTDAPYNRASRRVTRLLSQIYFELSEFHKPGVRS
ncbi:MAG: CZB domain-containing protein [Thiomonas sp.]